MALLSIEHMERERAPADEALGPWLRLVVDQLDFPNSQECIKYRGKAAPSSFPEERQEAPFFSMQRWITATWPYWGHEPLLFSETIPF